MELTRSIDPQRPLLVCALPAEAAHLHAGDLPVLITGLGKVEAAVSVTRALSTARPAFIVNLGTAGALRDGLTGTHVTAITARGAQRLSCDAVAELLVVDKRGHLDAISTRWRTAPPGMRRYVLMREHGKCRFPGCHTQIREVHHIIHWANGGPTETSNLVGLCSHHHHLVHEGGWTLSGHPDHTLIFTDRLKRTWRSDPPHRE